MLVTSITLFLVALAATSPLRAVGLSYPVCDTIAEEFITASPRLQGDWPFYSLLYTCSGNLNLEGYSVDACVLNGTKCGQAAADAFCQYLGFDHSSVDLFTTVAATAPAISMTGEWCTSPGVYQDLGHPNRTRFEEIAVANQGPYCTTLDSVTCVRTRDSLRKATSTIRANAAAAVPTPAPLEASRPPQTADVLVNPSTFSAGRRMQGVARS